ncbi:MAG: FkbM family methyltransferase [Magnetococcales bacterium]|nr:FkbM family methyltransferase [Magnetococcales bacterium]
MEHFDLKISNDVANKHRKELPTYNNFNITELHKMPMLFDWVECRVTDDCKFKMLLGGKDDGVVMRFFWNGKYEAATLRAWVYFAAKGGIKIDIGAHTGAYTLAALKADFGKDVFSFEPHFMNYSRLNLNIRANNFNTGNSFMMAVGAVTQLREFSISTNIDYLSTGGSLDKKDGMIKNSVQTVNLDSTFDSQIHDKIKLIKIDVEGHEGECLTGMSAIIDTARPTIFFECIDSTSGINVERFLKSRNYIVYEIDDITGKLSEVENVVPHIGSNGMPIMHKINRIAVPAQQRLLVDSF